MSAPVADIGRDECRIKRGVQLPLPFPPYSRNHVQSINIPPPRENRKIGLKMRIFVGLIR